MVYLDPLRITKWSQNKLMTVNLIGEVPPYSGKPNIYVFFFFFTLLYFKRILVKIYIILRVFLHFTPYNIREFPIKCQFENILADYSWHPCAPSVALPLPQSQFSLYTFPLSSQSFMVGPWFEHTIFTLHPMAVSLNSVITFNPTVRLPLHHLLS